MTGIRTVQRAGATAAGSLLLLVGAALYSDSLGVTDFVSVSGGNIELGLLPSWGGGTMATPFRVPEGGLHAITRRWAPIFAVVGFLGSTVIMRRWMPRIRGAWPVGLHGAVALALAAATMTAFLPIGAGQRAAVSHAVSTAGFVILVASVWGRALGSFGVPVSRFVDRATGPRPQRVALYAAGALGVGALLLSAWIFDRTPHVVDGIAHLFQARTFGSGRLFLESHPLPEFFDLNTMVNDGRWYSQYPPGHTVLLLLGSTLGIPWAVNPLLGAVLVGATYLLGRDVYGGHVARTGVVLVVLSPFVALMSSEFYSHATAAACLTLALWAYVRFDRRGTRGVALFGAVMLGFALLSRPLTAMAFSVPIVIDAVMHRRKWTSKEKVVSVVLATGIVLVSGLVLLAYNAGTTGDPFAFGYALAKGPGFGDPDAVSPLLTLGRLQLLNDALFAWPIPSLVLVACAFLGRTPGRWDYVLVAVPFSLLLFHAPIGYRDAEFGPRYVYEASSALILLAALGLDRLPEVAERFQLRGAPAAVANQWRGAVALAFVTALALSWPARVGYYGSPVWEWAVRDDAGRAVDEAELANAIVFVSTSPDHGNRYFEAVFLRNAPDLESGDVLFALDLDERNAELMDLYPERSAWRFESGRLSELRR